MTFTSTVMVALRVNNPKNELIETAVQPSDNLAKYFPSNIHTCPILRHRCPAQRVELSGDILRQLFTPILSRTEDQHGASFLYRLQTKLYDMVIVPL